MSLKRFGDQENRKRIDQDESRLGFEVDFDRIIFSDSFRSLQDKTQVVPLSQTDFVHTRLTHSLEVSVVARSLGRIVGKYIIDKYPDLREKGYRPMISVQLLPQQPSLMILVTPLSGIVVKNLLENFFFRVTASNLKSNLMISNGRTLLNLKEMQMVLKFSLKASTI